MTDPAPRALGPFLYLVAGAYEVNREWRLGQAHMNVLAGYDRALYDQLSGTEADPFFVDSKLRAFYDALLEKWSGRMRPCDTCGTQIHESQIDCGHDW